MCQRKGLGFHAIALLLIAGRVAPKGLILLIYFFTILIAIGGEKSAFEMEK